MAGNGTDVDMGPERPARLLTADQPEMRETLRAFVRDTLGPDYIIDPDALLSGSRMVARDRGRGSVAPGGVAPLPMPPVTLDLVVGGGEPCRLLGAGKALVIAKGCTPL